jgi:hypothetical protein
VKLHYASLNSEGLPEQYEIHIEPRRETRLVEYSRKKNQLQCPAGSEPYIKHFTPGAGPRLSSADGCRRWDTVCRSAPSSLAESKSSFRCRLAVSDESDNASEAFSNPNGSRARRWGKSSWSSDANRLRSISCALIKRLLSCN